MVREEWKRLLHNKILIIVMAAIIAIPTIYTTFFLGSMWDPYGELKHLPVAVVNNDQPVIYRDERLAIGETLVDNLKEDGSLDFHFVGADEAQSGLKNGTYYMIITIPSDFSANASTLFDASPQKMQLSYETNPGKNYIAAKMSDSALQKIRDSISEEVTKEYTEALFSEITEAGDGMQDAADGAAEIRDGASDAADGSEELAKNLKKLADSSLTFAAGSEELTVGIQTYTDGVEAADEGANEIAKGLHTLQSSSTKGTKELYDGANTLADGVEEYTSGVAQAQAGAQQLSGKSAELVQGVTKVAGGVTTLKAGADAELAGLQELSEQLGQQLSGGASQMQAIENGLSDLENGIGELAANMEMLSDAAGSLDAQTLAQTISQLNEKVQELDQSAGQLLPASGQMIGGLAEGLTDVKTALDRTGEDMGLIQGMQAVDLGLESISTGLTSSDGLVAGVKSYTDGVGAVYAGLTQLNENSEDLADGASELRSGVKTLKNELSDGITKLRDGADELADGTNELAANSASLVSGAQDLQDGAEKISSGGHKLYDGSQELEDGLVSLKDGAGTLQTSLADGADTMNSIETDDDTVNMFASPVESEKTEVSTVANNGHAMAAYMMSVALWVACIAFCIMYPLNEYEGTLRSGGSWWLSKISVAYGLAIVQAVVMVLLLGKFNGFAPVDFEKTLLIAGISSIAFMSIMYYFNVLIGKVGSFMMLIFMVIQLAGSAGTYPLEISGNLAPKLNPYLPFSYTVSAFRKTISGAGSLQTELTVLCGIILVFSVLSLLLFRIRARRIKAGKPILLNYFEKAGLA